VTAISVFDSTLRRVRAVTRHVERVAPLIGASRTLAVVTSVINIAADMRGVDAVRPSRPVCLDGDSSAIDAICRVADEAGVGRVTTQGSGHNIREHDGCEWGIAEHWRHGPHGDPTVLPRVAWESLGHSIAVSVATITYGTRTRLERDALTVALPSTIGHRVAAEAKALHAAGEPVGQLLYGPPGTGKSVIARWVAAELGGFSLRARLGDVSTSTLLTLVRLLAPRTVILDDIDRGDGAAAALDLAELLTARGVVLIVTANDTGKLDYALLRARRCGLHYRVVGIEPGLRDEILAGLDVPDDVRESLVTIAAARDYAGHHRALGPDRALEILRGRV
jgi:hypothetical protein